MKQLLLVFAIILTANFLAAQNKLNKKNIIGTWVVSSLIMDGTVHDFATDSTIFSDELKASFKTTEDSLQSVKFLKVFFEIIKGSGFSFDAKGVYKEIDAKNKIRIGTYTINEKTGIVSTKLSGTKKISNLKTEIKAGIISFKDLAEERDMIIFCKKKK